MKKIFVTLLVLVGITAIAQRPEGKKQDSKMEDFTPEQIATLHTKKMTLALDLTTAQQSKVKTLALENAKERKEKMEERKAKRKDKEGIRPTKDERFAMQNAMLDHKIAQKAKMKQILSDEQYTKWEKMQAHRFKKMGKHKKHAKKRKGPKKEEK